jgi:hypothetical protein
MNQLTRLSHATVNAPTFFGSRYQVAIPISDLELVIPGE